MALAVPLIPTAARAHRSWPTAEVHVYAAHHGFNCDHRAQYDQAAATLARERTMAFFASNLGA